MQSYAIFAKTHHFQQLRKVKITTFGYSKTVFQLKPRVLIIRGQLEE